jgi:hydroxypyruvate isomerase
MIDALTRREMIRALAGTAFARVHAPATESDSPKRKGHIKQSVARWCYPKMGVDALSAYGAEIGLKAVDLLDPGEFEIPRRYGLVCSMGYAGAGTISRGLNRIENHAGIEEGLRKNIPIAAKAMVPNVITFSGNRGDLSEDQGIRNTVIGLNRMKKIAEDHGVTICMELLNSKVNHPDYMCDHTAWGTRVMEEVNSPNLKLLYDIYHMQIMEGDLISTIQKNIQWIAHFHTGGVPGRHELDDKQEVKWDGIMRGILATSFQGYVAHEFLPTGDPKASLLQAVTLCDV